MTTKILGGGRLRGGPHMGKIMEIDEKERKTPGRSCKSDISHKPKTDGEGRIYVMKKSDTAWVEKIKRKHLLHTCKEKGQTPRRRHTIPGGPVSYPHLWQE